MKRKKRKKRKRLNGRKWYPSQKMIAEVQRDLLERLPHIEDALNAHDTCWACGWVGHVERAHILPWKDRRDNAPTNFFLLCEVCHRRQPDGQPRHIQELWLASQEWWSIRSSRMAHEMLDVLREVSYAWCGSDIPVEGWVRSHGPEAIRTALREGGARAARPASYSAISNARWGLVTDFDAFLRQSIPYRPPTDTAQEGAS